MRACWLAVVVSFLALGCVTGCVAETPDLLADDADAGDLALEEGAADHARSVAPYYLGRQDARRCRFPLCGGVWLSRPNRAVMTCADGSRAAECYVALVESDAVAPEALSELAAGRAIVQGHFGRGEAGEFGSYDTLVVERAWVAATDAAADGFFYHLADNGLRCLRAPCFSIDEQLVNTFVDREISDLDLSATGASDDQIGAAFEALSGQGILASGYNWRYRRTGAIVLEASTLWLPAAPAVDPALACATDADCTSTVFHSAVETRDDCYCTTCPSTVVNVATAEANAAAHGAMCEGAPESCPVVRCARPLPTACVAGICQFVDAL